MKPKSALIALALFTLASGSAQAGSHLDLRADANKFFFGGAEGTRRYTSTHDTQPCELLVTNEAGTAGATTLTVAETGARALSFPISLQTRGLAFAADHDVRQGVLHLLAGAHAEVHVQKRGRAEYAVQLRKGAETLRCVVSQ